MSDRAEIDAIVAACRDNAKTRATSYRTLYYAARIIGKDSNRLARIANKFEKEIGYESVRGDEYSWFYENASGWEVQHDLVIAGASGDINAFFARVRAVGFSLLREGSITSETFAECLDFYQTYKFEGIFRGTNEKTRMIVSKLEKGRNQCSHLYFEMGDPLLDWSRIPTAQSVWSARHYADIDDIPIGKPVVVETATAEKRFIEFLSGVNPADDDFPRNAYFAGGLISKVVSAAYETENTFLSDIDIFISGITDTERAAGVKAILEYLKRIYTNVWYSTFGSVCTVYVLDLRRVFQIVSTSHSTYQHALAMFDMTHIQWAYVDGKFICTAGAYLAARRRTTVARNLKRWRPNRLVKAIVNGYDIEKFEQALVDIDVDNVLANEDVFFELARDALGKCYHPTTIGGKLTKISERIIIANIRAQPNCQHVFTDPTEAIENITIGGDFMSGYGVSSAWDARNIEVGMIAMHNRYEGVLRSRTGKMIQRLPEVEVTKIQIIEDQNPILHIRSTPEIERFLAATVEVLRPVIGDLEDKTDIVKDGQITIDIDLGYMIHLEKTKKSILRNQHGVYLNLAEDLSAGDRVQVSVNVYLQKRGGGRDPSVKLSLRGVMITKRTAYINTGERVCKNNSLDDEVEKSVSAKIKEINDAPSNDKNNDDDIVEYEDLDVYDDE